MKAICSLILDVTLRCKCLPGWEMKAPFCIITEPKEKNQVHRWLMMHILQLRMEMILILTLSNLIPSLESNNCSLMNSQPQSLIQCPDPKSTP